MYELILTTIIFVMFVIYLRNQQLAHEERVGKYQIRIHVNGIRGKSTVTRLIAGVLREAGYRTLAKTTGSAARIIDTDGNDNSIPRRGPANVREQQDIIARWEPFEAEAMVIECMALHPKYQEWAERMIVKSHIGVITNVREDHQDVMGESLADIAASMAHMCPFNGNLITAENNPELIALLREKAEERGSKLIVVDPTTVSDEEIARFDYVSFKDNIAIGLAIADLLDIDRETAMDGMVKAKEDIGVLRLKRLNLLDKLVIWANLFAVNDRESMIINMEMLKLHCDKNTIKIGILNNRYDREKRAEQFSDVAAKDLSFDWLITFGAYEDLVTRKLINNGFPRDRIVNLGFSINPTIDQIIEAISGMIPDGYKGLLVGLVNIHTEQAEMMMEFFEGIQGMADRPQIAHNAIAARSRGGISSQC